MSRIILSKYDNGEDRFVIGWDHPAGGAFWQEFARETNPETGKPYWEDDDEWQETLRNGGMWPGIPLDQFKQSVPEDLRDLITDKVMGLLKEHAEDPDSGYKTPPIDLAVMQ